jgi:hypothetical protein
MNFVRARDSEPKNQKSRRYHAAIKLSSRGGLSQSIWPRRGRCNARAGVVRHSVLHLFSLARDSLSGFGRSHRLQRLSCCGCGKKDSAWVCWWHLGAIEAALEANRDQVPGVCQPPQFNDGGEGSSAETG